MDRQANMGNVITHASLSKYLETNYTNRQDSNCQSSQMSDMLDWLVAELDILKPKTIDKLENVLDNTKEAFERFERDNPRSGLVGNQYYPIEVVIISIQLFYDNFHPLRVGWVIDVTILAKYKKYIKHEKN
jgi:hypothetical protein